jgi:hypothetical protein
VPKGGEAGRVALTTPPTTSSATVSIPSVFSVFNEEIYTCWCHYQNQFRHMESMQAKGLLHHRQSANNVEKYPMQIGNVDACVPSLLHLWSAFQKSKKKLV